MKRQPVIKIHGTSKRIRSLILARVRKSNSKKIRYKIGSGYNESWQRTAEVLKSEGKLSLRKNGRWTT